MFAIYKGLELSQVQTIPNAPATPDSPAGDWYGSYADYLVHSQNSDGSWTGYSYWDPYLATAWYTDILQKTVFVRPPVVQNFVVDIGTPQRSMVRSLTVTFQDPAYLDAGAFSLTTTTPGIKPVTLNVSPALGTGVGYQTYTITFSGAGIIGGSLEDGRYTLVISASKVHNSAGQPMAQDYTQKFFRFFGDSNGDGVVDATDYAAFRTAYLSGVATGPNSVFDFNGNGSFSLIDLNAFTSNFRKRRLS